MKELLTQIKQRWNDLALREKQFVVGGGVLAGIFIVYHFMWMPLINNMTSMRHNIQENEKTLAWMRAADAQIQKLSRTATRQDKPFSLAVLLGYLQDKIKQSELSPYLTQLKQATGQTIIMHFKKVPFDDFISLLITILKEQQIAVERMSVAAENTPGIVNVEVVLKQ